MSCVKRSIALKKSKYKIPPGASLVESRIFSSGRCITIEGEWVTTYYRSNSWDDQSQRFPPAIKSSKLPQVGHEEIALVVEFVF